MTLKIVYRDPKALVPYERNARTHSPEQIEQIRASIRAFGFTNPVLLREDGKSIGAGHGRVTAALAEEIGSIPTIIIPGLTEAEWRAYIIADNKLALNAGWDEAMLAFEIGELKGLDFSIKLLGFDAIELQEILEPEPPKKANGSLMDRFMIAPFSVMSARDGWWQNRKRLWLELGIQSELGRGESDSDASFKNQGAQRALVEGKPHRKANAIPGGQCCPLNAPRKPRGGGGAASPGGSLMPAADYSRRQRGNGKGQPIA